MFSARTRCIRCVFFSQPTQSIRVCFWRDWHLCVFWFDWHNYRHFVCLKMFHRKHLRYKKAFSKVNFIECRVYVNVCLFWLPVHSMNDFIRKHSVIVIIPITESRVRPWPITSKLKIICPYSHLSFDKSVNCLCWLQEFPLQCLQVVRKQKDRGLQR